MNLSEVRSLVRLRRPVLDRTERTLARCVTIEDLQAEAWRHWPRGVRGYVEGGADGEISLRRNRAAYRDHELVPSVLRDVGTVDTASTLLGAPVTLPLALGPTGYTRMMHTDGEPAVARAARAAGVPYTLSTMGTTSIEDVAGAAGGDLWFQLYVWRDRRLMRELMDRAQASGYRVLMLTVDTPVTGLRTHDAHNGFTVPPQLSPSTLVDMARHPRWCAGLLTGPPVTFASVVGYGDHSPASAIEFSAKQFDPTVTWDDLALIRETWRGPLVVKGIASPKDAALAVDAGVDALVLSNHGGRQLDQAIAPLHALPAVLDAVGDRAEVLVDSGIRRGGDLAIALALGASGCLVGRPYLYGLGAGGERGVALALRMLHEELTRAMALMGVSSIAELRAAGPRLVRPVGSWRAAAAVRKGATT